MACRRRGTLPTWCGPSGKDVKVVDASAVAAVLFDEPDAKAMARQLHGARLVAPASFGFELANVCLVKRRRHPDLGDALAAAFRLCSRLGVTEAAVDHDAVLALATETDLTAHDASYVWLARQFDAALVTLDRVLASAAGMARAG